MRIIAGVKRGKKLLLPPDTKTRPLVDRIKEALFSILYPNVPGKTVADFYAGSGSFGLEALSRGAERALFVEADREVLGILKRNIQETGFGERSTVCSAKVFPWISTQNGASETRFDILFFDPPFKDVFDSGFITDWNTYRKDIYNLTAENGFVIIRVPSRFKDEIETERLFDKEKDRTYGKSRLIILRRAG